MVAAGAAALMAASEGGSSKGADDVASRYDAQRAQTSRDGSGARSVKSEKKNSLRSPTSNKAVACIRETKASRLRAASIVSPTDGTPGSGRSVADSSCSLNLQTASSLSRKPKSPMSSISRIPTCTTTTREKDKTVRRNSVRTKSPETEEKRSQHATYYEKTSERARTRRQLAKQSSSSSSSASSASSRQEFNVTVRKTDGQRIGTDFSTTGTYAVASSSGMRTRSSTQRSREDMEDRYDECCSLDNQPSADEVSDCPEFRHNFERCRLDDPDYNDDEDDDDNEDDYNDRYSSNVDVENFPSDRRTDVDVDDRRSYREQSSRSTFRGSYFPSTSTTDDLPNHRKSQKSESSTPPEKKYVSPCKIDGRTNVSEIAQRFKALENPSNATDATVAEKSRSNAKKYGGESIDQHRTDRFNTQPVTYAEVREAVLQNQRNAEATKNHEKNSFASNGDEKNSRRGEIDPSKLSLAERVRLFDRRVATETIVKHGETTDRSQRRRPANRYKTQPITLEEVEVATRNFPTDGASSASDSGESPGPDDEATVVRGKSPTICPNVAAPRSILKYTTSQSTNKHFSKSTRIVEEIFVTAETSSSIREFGSTTVKTTFDGFAVERSEKRGRNDLLRQSKGREIVETTIDENYGIDVETLRPSLSQKNSVPCTSDVAADDLCDDEIVEGSDTGDCISVLRNDVGFPSEKLGKHRSTGANEKSRCYNEAIEGPVHGRRERMMTEVQQIDFPSISIADRLAALQRRGTTDWKRRINNETLTVPSGIAKFTVNEIPRNVVVQSEKDDLSTKQQKLAERLEKLESAAEGWRKRVAIPDAVKFSVAGKMKVEQMEIDVAGPLSPLVEVAANSAVEGKKKVPRPERFRSQKTAKQTGSNATRSEEGLKVPTAFSDPVSEESDDDSRSMQRPVSILSVPRADDETFTSFFSNVSFAKCEAETLDLAETDFDDVVSFSERLGMRRTVQTQRRRLPSKNPLRTLAARTDLKDEYTETTTGVAERVMRSLNVEKLAQKSSLAIEALAGLASTEDFGAVTLKNVCQDSTSHGNRLPPHKDLMLILIKGRRHVQVRLVEPVAGSINSGDNYILVTKNELYNYVGKYSNVIERVRGAEIALSIQQNRDLGCRATQVITVTEEKPTCTNEQTLSFWKILGADAHTVEVIAGGHPDEDELYESALTDTNMVYEVVSEDELAPLENYWGAIPRIEMLDPSKILIFDFGSEMYVWNGRIAAADKRKFATHLAEELWREGYDYTECTVSPITSASIIGRRGKIVGDAKKSGARPQWCLIAKLTQHMETVLFREKFLDWPNVTGIIRVRENGEKDQVDGKIVVEPPDVDSMIDADVPVVDFVLEGCHLGRGTGWYDDELMRQSVVATTNVTVWHIDEFSYSQLSGSSIGQFYTGDSYIVRWMYTVTMTGRGLSGEPSKHASKGRDRCAYFIWQGQKASLNEQGTAALLTVELDQEQGPQIRVVEGFEPSVFLNLFHGRMIVHAGKKSKKTTNKKWRLYVYRGNEDTESSLTEVPCSTRQLRSRGSVLLIDAKNGKIWVWHGRAANARMRQNAVRIANVLKSNRPEEAGLGDHIDVAVREINEVDEQPDAFFEALGGMNKQLYVPLQGNKIPNHTPRLFHLSSVSGEFAATELLCPHRSEAVTPFPFLQNELYQVNQPALFLLDNKDELWLWQGWWPDSGSEDQTGSGAVRWQAERRAAMVMAVRYWKKLHPESDDCPVYLVWAGLEPLAFTNLFPTWNYRDEIAELNIRDGRDSGEVLTVEGELARLTQSTYPPAQLLQRPLPEGVDPTILEQYLSPQHFEELLGMNAEAFEELPAWKQINIKKKIGLF